MRIHEYQDEENPGIVIRTYRASYCSKCYPSVDNINEVHRTIHNDGDNWDAINSRLEKYGMCSLNNSYHCTPNNNVNVQTCAWVGDGDWTYHIQIYHEDADGNLTLINEGANQ